MISKNIGFFALLLISSISASEHMQQDALLAQYKKAKQQLEQEVGKVKDWLKHSANQNDENKLVDADHYLQAVHFLTHNTIPRVRRDSIDILRTIDPYFYQFIEEDANRLQPLVETLHLLGQQLFK